MSDYGNSTSCDPNPVASPATTAYLFTLHVVTLSALGAAAKFGHDAVEVAHPVFALAAQEVPVMMGCKAAEVALLAMMVADVGGGTVVELYTFVPLTVLQFHQLTWFFITLLRFYLLFVVDATSDVSMPRLRRLSRLSVWASAVLLIPLSQLPWFAIASSNGWPERSIQQIAQTDPALSTLLISATMAMANIPDYLSIVVYLLMVCCHLRRVKASAVVAPQRPVEDADEPYGGIWIGESNDERATLKESERVDLDESGGHNQVSLPLDLVSVAHYKEQQQDQQNNADCGQKHQEQQLPQHQEEQQQQLHQVQLEEQQQQQQHKFHAVMSVLRWHVALSLFDLSATGINMFYCYGEAGKAVVYLFQIFCCYWIPLLTISKNYKRHLGIMSYLRQKLGC